ncbi:MAG: hypothetical protein JWR80_4595 [Bradyrhizobium sp.]|jgi:hypothetical protein|nr:hypothetical protein [Bradyrhizobium sp.]
MTVQKAFIKTNLSPILQRGDIETVVSLYGEEAVIEC